MCFWPQQFAVHACLYMHTVLWLATFINASVCVHVRTYMCVVCEIHPQGWGQMLDSKVGEKKEEEKILLFGLFHVL